MFGNSLINCIHISYFRAQFTLVVKRAGHITLENWTPPKALGRFRAPGQREKLGIEQFDLLHTYRLRKQKKVLILPKLGIKIRKLKKWIWIWRHSASRLSRQYCHLDKLKKKKIEKLFFKIHYISECDDDYTWVITRCPMLF